MNAVRCCLIWIVPTILILITFATIHYAHENRVFSQSGSAITISQLSIKNTPFWKRRWQFQEAQDNLGHQQNITAEGHILQLKSKERVCTIEYETEVDISLIKWVRQVRKANQVQGLIHFVVQYNQFNEILAVEGTKGQVCLQLKLEDRRNVQYLTDQDGHLWVVTAPMNRLLFVQIYSCREAKVVAELRYRLKSGGNINWAYAINTTGNTKPNCANVYLVSYSLEQIIVQICKGEQLSIEEKVQRKPYEISYTNVNITNWDAYNLEDVEDESIRRLWDHLYALFTFKDRKTVPPASETPITEIELADLSFEVVDSTKNYILRINGDNSSVIQLDRQLVHLHTPLFHHTKYDNLGIITVLEKGSQLPEEEFVYATLDDSLVRIRMLAAYDMFPNKRIQFLGIAKSSLIFMPHEGVQEDQFYLVRTKEGGLVLEGRKFKGTFDQLPVTDKEEIMQKVDAKAHEMIPQIFEAHIAYRQLIAYQKDGRIDLINALTGKSIISHHFRVKKGYRYISSYLLNSEWWVIEGSAEAGSSMAIKYELYLNNSSPTSILHIKRVYGDIGGSLQLSGEDQLADLLQKFSDMHQKGFVLLNVFRCLDEYYYFEYTSSDGSQYGVARLHYLSVSNRRVRNDKKYSGKFQMAMLVFEEDIIKPKASRKPHSVSLNALNIFPGLSVPTPMWHRRCDNSLRFQRLAKTYASNYLPVQAYLKSQDCAGNQQDSQDTINIFNMRRMIEQSINQQRKNNTEKKVVGTVLIILPLYLLAMMIVYRRAKYMSPEEVDNKQEKQSSVDSHSPPKGAENSLKAKESQEKEKKKKKKE